MHKPTSFGRFLGIHRAAKGRNWQHFALAGALTALLSACGGSDNNKQQADTRNPSVARLWNELVLDGIRGDFARPTVHARNLFHSSSAMYDAWAAYDKTASTYLLGKTLRGFDCPLTGEITSEAITADREAAISYAAYRIVEHRFANSPGVVTTMGEADDLMASLNLDTAFTSTDYSTGGAAALGNYIASCYIAYGFQDGANEENAYANEYYAPVNLPIHPYEPGNPDISDLDRWQPISLPLFIDQSGNIVSSQPQFLSPEWGAVEPFALNENDVSVYERDGFEYRIYHDPGMPPTAEGIFSDEYKWTFTLVVLWSSQLDQNDGVMIDISPASLGNIPYESLPTTFAGYHDFYNVEDGGDAAVGYAMNPKTGLPYEPQIVPRGDYARVLAEFWADGPDSETPPGHWFTIANTVSDHPDLVKKIGGVGPEVGPLEWDVKMYFALGGAMHDSAVAAWGIKGWYDYIRPVSAIRAMADFGQSSDPEGPFYHPNGIPLHDGLIEVVQSGDPLAGDADENVGKIKVYAWRGPDYILDPMVDQAGVGWILAENWWPYQRPSFVTPPFAGYVSGHSTYSRAGAEVMTELTGDPYFPGGMSGFEAPANEFLVFEEGPSVDLTLEWATYRDASDQCSLSRIWGGIHPPADDIPGRHIGAKIGPAAYKLASAYFNGEM